MRKVCEICLKEERLATRSCVHARAADNDVGSNQMRKGERKELVLNELLTDAPNNQEIADRLRVTKDTVEFHLKVLFKEYYAKSRGDLIIKALKQRYEK